MRSCSKSLLEVAAAVWEKQYLHTDTLNLVFLEVVAVWEEQCPHIGAKHSSTYSCTQAMPNTLFVESHELLRYPAHKPHHVTLHIRYAHDINIIFPTTQLICVFQLSISIFTGVYIMIQGYIAHMRISTTAAAIHYMHSCIGLL